MVLSCEILWCTLKKGFGFRGGRIAQNPNNKDCMPYLIDGHNLIPKIPGLHLDQLDDEHSLFTLLDKYFKRIRKKAVVYFDQASLSGHSNFHTAYLHAHFVRLPSSADQAILLQLKELGGDARNYTIVTSDHWIADNARAVGDSVISSDDFARKLLTAPSKSKNKSKNPDEDENYSLNNYQKNSEHFYIPLI